MSKKSGICILGSTGSIGQNTLDIIKQHPDLFELVALSARTSVDKLFEQCCSFTPKFAVIEDEKAAKLLQTRLKDHGINTKVLCGEAGLCEIVELPEVDKVVAAIVGGIGLLPTLKAVETGKQVLLANKEALVMSGNLLLAAAKKSGAILLPIDSEHNALFQCMPANYVTGERPKNVQQVILTASGGSFLHTPREDFKNITPEMACRHPNWVMGKKITVDCSTLMNKGLEVIEACLLFQLSKDEVEVVIHPQSIIHSLVEYNDGSILAQLGSPDMRIPIAYCLSWPLRITSGAKRISLTQMGRLDFIPPDTLKFRCLALAYDALKLGKAATAVLNASNEVAVEAFLNNKMCFSRIPTIIESVLHKYFDLSAGTLEDILWADKLAREYANKLIC